MRLFDMIRWGFESASGDNHGVSGTQLKILERVSDLAEQI
jgi:hypothetical protein